jgi:hypothetical protein
MNLMLRALSVLLVLLVCLSNVRAQTSTNVVLVASNATHRYFKGLSEASSPISTWRQLSFDDAIWSSAPAPFFYGDTGYTNAAIPGTRMGDMQGLYSSIYLRKPFVVANPSAVTNAFLVAQSDDGFIAWINGIEVVRYNMPSGDIPYNGVASIASPEPNNNGAAYITHSLTDPRGYLVEGTNVLAVHAFNQSLSSSSDFGFNAQLEALLADASVLPPRVLSVSPLAGEVFYLTNITVTFSEPVSGVNASDLLINGSPATSVTGGTSNSVFTIRFTQPAYGAVSISWAVGHGIADFDSPPKAFDATAAGATWQYALRNPNAPVIASQNPPAGATVSQLTLMAVTFNKNVTGVNAADLLVNGVVATGLSGSGANYTFAFGQPDYGPVAISWAANHGIRDAAASTNLFDPSQPGNTWACTLVDQTPPAVASKNPPASSPVTNLTQITVVFTEAVSGVDASDLLINGTPASGVSGSGASYTFSFAPPNATLINITWAANHGIRDLAAVPNSFDGTALGATWSYTTADTVPPAMASIDPLPGITLRALSQITVTFSEPVTGVDAADLLVNAAPAQAVSGAGAGPFMFQFLQPSNGLVNVRWATNHGIHDLATPANAFTGAAWNYTLDPNASSAGKVVMSEIMYHPAPEMPEDVRYEWIELHNKDTVPVNLNGWQLTKGVNYTFTNASIPAGGYLVVAANVAAFRTQYPSVTNVVGDWVGRLSNNGDDIHLRNALGDLIENVAYASQGDWATRLRGLGERQITSLTRNGSTVTAYAFAHELHVGDQIRIYGADQPEYNGIFTVANPTVSTFTYTISGSPAPATGVVIFRQITTCNGGACYSGWSWSSLADGLGRSMELMNEILPTQSGQNWAASRVLHGTPGRANSMATNHIPPMILDLQHFPLVPPSTSPVTITARLLDENTNGLAATLFFRNASSSSLPAFSSVAMLDDGAHGDGAAGDGIYGAILVPQPNLTVIEFYVAATNALGLGRTWPPAGLDANDLPLQQANAHYQVDDSIYAGSQPLYRFVMTEPDRAELRSEHDNDVNSENSLNAMMNLTFITIEGAESLCIYSSGARNRGAGSRGAWPMNYRVSFPNDKRWKGARGIHLNTQYTHSQLAGYASGINSGLDVEAARAVQLRVNGANLANDNTSLTYGSYIQLEDTDSDYAASHYPNDSNGNAYRGSKYPWDANLTYYGMDPNVYYGARGRGYYKNSNVSENDWSDLINLSAVMNTNTPDDTIYAEAVRKVVNVEQWMRSFAVYALNGSGETAFQTGVGDDYAMYRGIEDPRFILLGHDLDTCFGIGGTSTSANLFRMCPFVGYGSANATVLNRFMTNAYFAPVYYQQLNELLNTSFSPEQISRTLDQALGDWVPATPTLLDMKTWATNRYTWVRSQIPLALTISHSLSIDPSGYPYTTSATIALNGVANAIQTRTVLVNGSPAVWTAWRAQWTHSSVSLLPGINRVLVQALDVDGHEINRRTLDVWYNKGSVTTVAGGNLTGNTTWLAANGPYRVTSAVTIPSGSVLTIQPGTTVYFDFNVDLTIRGQLLASGTDAQHIRFTRQPGTGNIWHNLQFLNPASESRLTYADIEYSGSGPTIVATNAVLHLDHVTFTNISSQYLGLENSSFNIRNSTFASLYDTEMVIGRGLPANGYGIFEGNWFGATTDLRDTLHFTGGKRPNAILQILNNVFTGSYDDILGLDGTDAHIEGNVFMGAHQVIPGGDTANAISAGQEGGNTSQLTIARNLFFDCDHAVLAKDGSFHTLENNTIIHMTSAAVSFAEPLLASAGGAGARLDGNIIWDMPALFENYTSAVMQVTVDHSLLPTTFAGTGNLVGDPMLRNTNTVTWQTITNDFALRPGSPAIGTGPNGLDMGGLVPPGASIAGEPASPTPKHAATLTVGGPGVTHFRYRINKGSYATNEYAVATPILLSNLVNGSYSVRVIGRNSAGAWQVTNAETLSRTWLVNTNDPALRLNELLASNDSAVNHNGTAPDVVELYNVKGATLDLGGVRLTDDPLNPSKFVFPPGTSLVGGGYLVVYANNPDGTPGFHLGFNLNKDGGSLFLYDSVAGGGELLDSLTYGLQLTDLSIGRLEDGSWALCQPSFGSANVPARMGDQTRLKINEWLASAAVAYGSDFVELYNPEPLPVLLSGLYLTDNPIGWPTQHLVAPLTYAPPQGVTLFKADGNANAGPDHLSFKLSADRGVIALLSGNLALIDEVVYGPQTTDISQGRTPNGASRLAFFSQPSPGAPNPVNAGAPTTNITTITIPLVDWVSSWRYEATGTDMGTAWLAPSYNDSGWPVGLSRFDHGNPGMAVPVGTTIDWTSPQQITFYFRATFVLTNATTGFSLMASHYIDDGAVFYLNGQEIYRYNIQPGPVSYSTLASFISGPPPLVGPVALPSGNLVQGTNLLAVEVHQGTATSGDMELALNLALTKTTTNYTGGTPVVLNEILASNANLREPDGSKPDWVELYNQSAAAVDLGDQSLTDSLTTPRRWVFPLGTTIPAFGYLRVRCDSGAPSSATNTGFGLKASGGGVYLFDKSTNGGALLDSVVCGIQIPDLSIGRIPNGTGSWTLTIPSPGSVNLALSLGNASAMKVNEWMASPNTGDDWFEIYNPGSDPVALGGLRLSDDLTTAGLLKYPPIPALSFIGVQTNACLRFWADDNPSAGADHVRFQLKAAGEGIAIASAAGALIDDVSFGVQTAGVSEGRFPDGTTNIVAFPETASPGESNYRLLTNVVINEALTHSDLPLEDAIELRNLSAAPVDISGWYLSDAKGTLKKYRIPNGTILSANGYVVFYEYQFNFDPLNNPLAFALSSAKGDEVYLSAANTNAVLTGYRASVKFGPAENGVSFGRYVNSAGDEQFVAMSARTFGVDDPGSVEQFRTGTGLPNAYPKVGPVVLSEIMYHPPNLGTNDNARDEFIELHNITTAPVALYDPAFPTNTWRLGDAVDFEFPAGIVLAPGGELLVVSFDPIADPTTLTIFRTNYNVDPGTVILGPYRGKLANSSAKVELWKPDPPEPPGTPDAGFVPYVLVERIHYSDSAPWPPAADGTGYSLQRLTLAEFGNDPANWTAAAPTPGPQGLALDSDNDGISDAWELQYFGSLARDGTGDYDGDGVTDLNEYLGGTDPTDPHSLPVFTAALDGSICTLTLSVAAGRSYSVIYKNSLSDPTWIKLSDISPPPVAGLVRVVDYTAGSTPTRFYWWVTPAVP